MKSDHANTKDKPEGSEVVEPVRWKSIHLPGCSDEACVSHGHTEMISGCFH